MTTSAPTETPVEKVSQDEMLKQFKDRYASLIKENQDLSAKIKENEVTALKLLGAIETQSIMELQHQNQKLYQKLQKLQIS